MPIYALLLLALAAFPAGAQTSASFDIAVDPRFELLGVVSQLAGRARARDASAEYRERVEKRFGALRGHPAVALYGDLVSRGSREEAVATIPIYYSNPPELALKDTNADIHYLNGPGQAEEMQRFLHELRDFARSSEFMGFFRDNRGFYDQLERTASAALGSVDPVAAIESYLGLGLASRSHYILPPLNAGPRAFIVPYPLPPASAGASAFDAYTISEELLAKDFSNAVWHEPLFVFIDPSFYYFEKLNIPAPADFYGPAVARCRAAEPGCVKHFAVQAIIEHLNRKAGVPAGTGGKSSSGLERRLVKALSERLDEYDAHRDRYPTLWDFYPRWFAVFEESAYPGRAPRRLAVPAEPKLRTTADFFDPSVSELLLRASAR